MPLSTQHAQALLQKIQSLSEERISEVEDFVGFLKKRKKRTAIRKTAQPNHEALNFPVDDLGSWPEGLTLSREKMYDNDGR